MTTRIERANTVPETALVLALALSVLYGAVQTALLGFLQLSADGSAYAGGHETVVKYGGPGSANYAYTTTAAKSVYPHIAATYTPSVPASGVYETDIQTTLPVVLSGFFGPYISSSRDIEASSSTASLNNPLGNCVTATTGVVAPGANAVASSAVGVLQAATGTANSVFSLSQNVNGVTSVTLNPATSGIIASHVTVLSGINNDLSVTSTAIQNLSTLLNPSVLGVSLSGLTQPITQTISNVVSPALQDAIAGVPAAQMQTDLNNITSTVNLNGLLLSGTTKTAISALSGDINNVYTDVNKLSNFAVKTTCP